MSPRTLARHVLSVLPTVFVTWHFGSPWPAVTNVAATAGAMAAVIALSLIVSLSRHDFDDLVMADDATLKGIVREAFDALWNLPVVPAVTVVRLWLVWVLSPPSYAMELLTLVAILSALNLVWLAVFGMPTRSTGRA